MKYGFVKAAAATPRIRVADPSWNAEQIIAQIKQAKEAETEVLVFPELCLTGYTCGDLFGQRVLLDAAKESLRKIMQATETVRMLVFIGMPYEYKGKLYNVAAALFGGKVLALVPKTHLPNYGEFYEKRQFTAYFGENETAELFGEEVVFGNKICFTSRQNRDLVVAAEICEDLWAPQSPSLAHARAGATLIVNLSASDETAGKAEYRRLLLRGHSAKLVCGYVYADAGDGESTGDMAFSGHNLLCENGEILAESKLFENGITTAELDLEKINIERRRMQIFCDDAQEKGYATLWFDSNADSEKITRKFAKNPFVPEDAADMEKRAELILSIQTAGLKQRLLHTKVQSAVLGISGGLDSALALLVTVRVFDQLGWDRKNILTVTMPCFGTTDKTYQNSVALMNALGTTPRTVNIADSVRSHFKDIGHDESCKNAAYENAQARMRTMALMDIANDTNGLVIGTGDLSELALGWATYNGDHMSMYGVNASVPKTLVKYLIRWEAMRLGGEVGKILDSILNTEISPELLPPEEGKIAQKTEELVGPYELHDFYLYHAVRNGFSPDKVYFLAKYVFAQEYDAQTIKKWLQRFYVRFFSQQFKRSCLPDGVKLGSVSLSPRGDWRMPSDAVVAVWQRQIEQLK